MARSYKVGIDYFSHDVDMCQDRKMRILIAKHNLNGYGVFNRLLEELYREKGYYLEINEDFNILFSNDNNISIDVYINILNDCINMGLFNKNLYEKYNILTSKRIQMNYIEATKRRSKVEFNEEYLLLEIDFIDNFYPDKVNVDINKINVDINPKNDDIGTQRKGKERKGKERKEDNNDDADASEKFDYKSIYDFYIKQENLTSHTRYTKAMYNAMKSARKKHSLTKLQMINIIKDHNLLVKLTKGGKYEISARRLETLFGQRVDKTSGSPLICAEYLEGGTKKKWLEKLINGKASKNGKKEKSKNSFHDMQTGKNYTEDELNKQLGIKN